MLSAQVRWARDGIPIEFIFAATSHVLPSVVPPAPHVTEIKSGLSEESFSAASKTPAKLCSFFGGKSSNERTRFFFVRISFIVIKISVEEIAG